MCVGVGGMMRIHVMYVCYDTICINVMLCMSAVYVCYVCVFVYYVCYVCLICTCVVYVIKGLRNVWYACYVCTYEYALIVCMRRMYIMYVM